MVPRRKMLEVRLVYLERYSGACYVAECFDYICKVPFAVPYSSFPSFLGRTRSGGSMILRIKNPNLKFLESGPCFSSHVEDKEAIS